MFLIKSRTHRFSFPTYEKIFLVVSFRWSWFSCTNPLTFHWCFFKTQALHRYTLYQCDKLPNWAPKIIKHLEINESVPVHDVFILHWSKKIVFLVKWCEYLRDLTHLSKWQRKIPILYLFPLYKFQKPSVLFPNCS